MILVGDSLGMVVLGFENTLPVTMEEIIHHCKAVSRARPKALVVADMPFMSYQASVEDAVRNAGRLVKEGGAECVKLEGGQRYVPVIEAIVHASIPVVGHLGLTPQSLHQFGGYRVQGKDSRSAGSARERRGGPRAGRLLRDRSRGDSLAARPADHRSGLDPDDRHRRGAALLGADTRRPRYARHPRETAAALRQEIRRARAQDEGGRSDVRAGSEGGAFPRHGAQLRCGRRRKKDRTAGK